MVVGGCGLLARLIALGALCQHPLRSDALSYHTAAIQLLRGDGFTPYWPPGLPLYLAGVYRLFGEDQFVGRAAVLLFYVPFALCLYLLGKELAGTKAANAALLTFALYPTFILHSLEPLTQLPTATYLLAACWLSVLLARGRHWSHSVVLGIVLGLVTLTRPTAIFLVLFVPSFLAIRARKVRPALLCASVSLLIVSAWILQARHLTGRWVLINDANSMNLFLGNNPYTPLYKTWWLGSHGAGEPDVPGQFTELFRSIKANPPALAGSIYRQMALEHVLSRPDLFLIRTASRVRTFFAFDTYSGAYLIEAYSAPKLFGLGIIVVDALFYCGVMIATILAVFSFGSVRELPIGIATTLAVALVYAVPYFVSFSHPTYHFPIMPVCAAVAAGLATRGASIWAPGTSLADMFPRNTRLAIASMLIGFVCVQTEWVVVMQSRV